MCLCNDRCLPVTEEAAPIADMSYTLELAFQSSRAQSPRRYLLLLPPRRAEVRREGRCHTPGEVIKCPMSSPLPQGLALYLVGLITHPSLSSPVLHYSRIEIGQIPYCRERSGSRTARKKPGYYHTRYATNLHTCSLYYYGMYIYVRQVGIPVAKLQGCLFYSLLSADSRQRSRRTKSLVGEKYQV